MPNFYEERETRRRIARDQERILEAGWYLGPSGKRVEISESVRRAVEGTRLYGPEPVAFAPTGTTGACAIAATGETTLVAARRLSIRTGSIGILNFAEACTPGGGFFDGARAQEESLCRSSALYWCLKGQNAREFYKAHCASRDSFASDRVLHSPAVPVFRGDDFDLFDEPFEVGVLTAAAPDLNRATDKKREAAPAVLGNRIRQVLAVASAERYRRLVLGAWGCGAFKNDPEVVAAHFAAFLRPEGQFATAFDEVVFAIRASKNATEADNLKIFTRILAG